MDAQKQNCSADGFDDLWSSDKPLPTLAVLKQLISRICDLWGEGRLTAEIKAGYNKRLSTTLGRACYTDMRVELNPKLLAVHPDELISTLAHELAHLVVFKRYGRDAQPHGMEFRAMMRSLNLSSRATHDLPVAHLRNTRTSRYVYLHRCDSCGYQFVAKTVRRNYYCIDCGPGMKWEVFKIPNNNTGKKLLERLKRCS